MGGLLISVWCLKSGGQFFFRRVPLSKSEQRYFSDFHYTCDEPPFKSVIYVYLFSDLLWSVFFFISELLKTDIVESRWITLVFWVSFSSVRFKKKKILPFFNQCYCSVNYGREVHYFASLPVWSHFYKPVKMFSISQP